MSSSKFHVEIAREDEIPELAALITRTFGGNIETLLGNIDTPEGHKAVAKRHLRAWNEHRAETGRPPFIKCIHNDTGEMAACAQWYIFPKPRSTDNVTKPNYLLSAEWVPDGDDKAKILIAFGPMIESRIIWSRGRGIALFQYMATAKDWRRQGAATVCVQWGLDECASLGIPAYLEASAEGKLVYEKLGFQQIDEIPDDLGKTFPVMMWWPPGTKEEDKRPLEG